MWRENGRGWITLLIVAACLVTSGASARGDACSECGPPTREDLAQDPDFALEKRGGVPDYVEMHAGECRIDIDGTPRIQKDRSWLVLRGSGAVWNCPSSTSSDTMTASVTHSDRKEWSLSASSSASASFLGVGLTAEIVATVTAASSVKEVTEISKKLSANYCRIVAWYGYFEVADYSAEVDFRIERRFAWWTKNMYTGDRVHRKGELWLDCGAHVATLDMRAPIAGYFNLRQHPCRDPECKATPEKELGWYPPLPTGLQPPILPPDEDADEDQNEDDTEQPGEETDDPSDEGSGGEAPDGTAPDGDAPDGDAPDGDAPDGDAPDGDAADGESSDADLPSSDELGEAPSGALPDPLAPHAASAS